MRRGRPLVVEWQDDEAALLARYRAETRREVRPRWHALWLLRTGRTIRAVAAVLGVHERSVQQWVGWYRIGGLAEVAAHSKVGPGSRARLSAEQQQALIADAALGRFRTGAEAARWVQETFGVGDTASGIRHLLRRHACRPKVPRPVAENASPAEQEAWQRGAVPTP